MLMKNNVNEINTKLLNEHHADEQLTKRARLKQGACERKRWGENSATVSDALQRNSIQFTRYARCRTCKIINNKISWQNFEFFSKRNFFFYFFAFIFAFVLLHICTSATYFISFAISFLLIIDFYSPLKLALVCCCVRAGVPTLAQFAVGLYGM